MDPGDGWPPVTGVISPLSTNTTVLTVFRTEEAAFPSHFLQTAVAENPLDTTSLCSDVMGVMLSLTPDLLEDSITSSKFQPTAETPGRWLQDSLPHPPTLLSVDPSICYKTGESKLVLQAI